MAKDAHDREDLLRDATGYVQRVEFTIPDRDEPIFCGFRQCGAFSLYWTQADVLQFNSAGELRRAFWQHRMLASYKRQLHWLEKSEGRVRLERTLLSERELEKFQSEAANWLQQVRNRLNSSAIANVEEFPTEGNVLQQVNKWLGCNVELTLAIHPGLGKQTVSKNLSQRH